MSVRTRSILVAEVNSTVEALAARGHYPVNSDEHATEIQYHCPFPEHNDTTPSFFANTEKGVYHCFGCGKSGSLVDLVRALDASGQAPPPQPTTDVRESTAPEGTEPPHGQSTASAPGITIAQLAAAKRLHPEVLRNCGWRDIHVDSTEAISIPYWDEQRNKIATRLRLALVGDQRFRNKRGSRVHLYGRERLGQARKAGYVIIVEGETDTVTLWVNQFQAVGVPGANTWKPEWAGILKDIDLVYVVVEPDAGGEALLKRVAASTLRDRVRVIRLEGIAKDMNDLHVSGRVDFINTVRHLMKTAPCLTDEEMQAAKAAAAEAWDACREVAVDSDILTAFVDALHADGVAGEDRVLKLIILALTSRVLEQPVSLVLKGPSSAGKSYLPKRVCEYFPPEAYYALSAMSDKALIYSTEPLVHRFLMLYEAAGLQGETATYVLRSLQSEGHIRYETVIIEKDKPKAILIERQGPTGVIMTTTDVQVHGDNETRMLSVPVTITPEQTTDILLTIADRSEGLLPPTRRRDELRAQQTWIAGQDNRVTIPYIRKLAELTDPGATRMRRDFTTVIGLIQAHAVLHQATRSRDEQGRIIATIDDYAAIRPLIADIVAESSEQWVPQTVREVVQAVHELMPKELGTGVSIAALARHMELDTSNVRRRVLQALKPGAYLTNLGATRRAYELIIGEPMPADCEVLPLPEDL